ncbi:MAG: hypothetical protein AAGA54_23155 [Myxococcota bacterium]
MARSVILGLAAILGACGGGGAGGSTPAETDTDTGGAGTTSGGPSTGGADDSSGSAEDGVGETEPVACGDATYVDVLTPRWDDGASLPAEVQRSTARGEGGALLCGAGFVARADAGELDVLDVPGLTGTCTGLADLGGGQAVATSDAGDLVWVDLAAGAVLDGRTEPHPLFDVVAAKGAVWLAAGTEGVLSVPLVEGQLGAAQVVPGADDARGLLTTDAGLLVADGYVLGDIEDPTVGGARYRLLDADGGGAQAELVEGPGFAQRLVAASGRIFGIRPGHGLDELSVSGGRVSLASSLQVDEGILEVASDGDVLLAAAGSALLRLSTTEDGLAWVARDVRPDRGAVDGAWIRTVAHVDGAFMAGHGGRWAPVDTMAAQVAPEVSVEAFTFTMTEGQTEALFGLDNLGTAPLRVTDVMADAPFSAEVAADINPPTQGCPDEFLVPPGGRLLFWLRHDDSEPVSEGTLRILSNDPDQPTYVASVERGRPPAQVGDAVEPFRVLTVDGRDFDSRDQLGKVVLAKLYNPL